MPELTSEGPKDRRRSCGALRHQRGRGENNAGSHGEGRRDPWRNSMSPSSAEAGQWMRGGMTNASVRRPTTPSRSHRWKPRQRALQFCGRATRNIFAPVAQSHSRSQDSLGGEGVKPTRESPRQAGYRGGPRGSPNPSVTGSQNVLRYAYFPASNRLAIDDQGRVEVYDTSGHGIFAASVTSRAATPRPPSPANAVSFALTAFPARQAARGSTKENCLPQGASYRFQRLPSS